MAKLLVQESSGVREFELVDAEVKIGRELDNVLRLADPSISRHHALIRKTAVGYEVQDLGSSNGVLLNGTKVSTSPLQDGDRVTLGQIQLTFMDPKPVVEEPASPLGTVRLNPEDMKRVQGFNPPEPVLPPAAPVPPPPPAPLAPTPLLPPPMATPVPPPPTPVPPPPMASPVPPPPAPVPPPPAMAPVTQMPLPEASSGENPAPGFLRAWLPPVPDDAEPIMLDGVPERGDFVTRLLACLIDAAPLVAINILISIASAILGRLIPFFGCLTTGLSILLSFSYIFFQLWCWTKFGATPGKKMMKLRVVPEDNPFGRIEMGTALLRFLGHFINTCLAGLPYLMIFGAERKGLQDIISKSICIKVDR